MKNFSEELEYSCKPGRSKKGRKRKSMKEILKVKSSSNPNSVAGAMTGAIRKGNAVEIDAIGAGAVNQTMKAIAIANGFVAPMGKTIICVPAFEEFEIDGKVKTGLCLKVKFDY